MDPVVKNRLVGFLMPIGFLCVLIAVWSAATAIFKIPSYLLPSPEEISVAIYRNWKVLSVGAGHTLLSVLLGFGLSTVVGVPIAFLIVLNKTSERLLMPIIVMSQTIPKVAIAPILIIWLGFGILPKVAVTFLITFFPIVVSTVVGLRSVETDMLDLVRSMGGGKVKLVWRVRMPSALPHLFGGLKIAICLAVVGAIVGEFVGSDEGLGHLLLMSAGSLNGPMTWAALVILIAIGMLLFSAVTLIERWVIPWHVSIRTEDTTLYQH